MTEKRPAPAADWFDIPRTRELVRLEHDGRVLVVYGQGNHLILANEDDVSAQSVVLTNYEVRWLANLWRPADDVPRWRYWWVNLMWRLRRV